KTEDEVLEIVAIGEEENKEKEKKREEKKKEEAKKEGVAEVAQKPLIVAVTACPTGIAHTYMAEDALKEKAEQLGIDIRVETNGSDGAKNVLTSKEIQRAAGVIISADKNVEMARFDGKRMIKTPVSEAIRNPEKLINKILNGEGKLYHSDEKSSGDD